MPAVLLYLTVIAHALVGGVFLAFSDFIMRGPVGHQRSG